MKKLLAALLVLTLAATGVSALAEDIFTAEMRARLMARQALEEKYGLDMNLLGYFSEACAQDGGAYTVEYYSSFEDMDYVLGRYTVRVENGAASASWSWDGREVPYADRGLASHAWGRDQLREIWAINYQTSDLQNYALIARNLCASAGYQPGYISPIPESDDYPELPEVDEKNVHYSLEACRKIALQGIQEAYRFTDEKMSGFGVGEEAWIAETNARGEVLTTVECVSWDENVGWQPGDGMYLVLVNQTTGLVEDIQYVDGVIGNG